MSGVPRHLKLHGYIDNHKDFIAIAKQVDNDVELQKKAKAKNDRQQRQGRGPNRSDETKHMTPAHLRKLVPGEGFIIGVYLYEGEDFFQGDALDSTLYVF